VRKLNSTLLVIVIAAVAVLVLVGLVAGIVGGRGRTSRLRPLPDESRERFGRQWRLVETRFLDDPRGAVQDADKMVVMLLSERGAKLDDKKRVPGELRRAREAAASDQGRQGTEGMRKAMRHYKRVVDDGVGSERMRPEGRREVAS
jgi:hypothetical protein